MTSSLSRKKSIFISGGASGIGMETAKRMLDRGWVVGCYDIVPVEWHTDPNLGLDLDEGQLITGHLDVRNWEDWVAAVEDFTSHTGGRLDGFFNNAGVIIDGPLSEQDPERIQWILDINCVGVTYGAKACHPYLKRTKDSVMVSMCSASAIFGQPDISTYSASKFYVKGLTEALSLEWRKDNIRVTDLAPLWAKTKIADVNARSVRTLGVRLEPGDVADVAEKVFAEPSFIQKFRLHHGVSVPDKVLKALSDFAPDTLRRAATKVLVG
ncbi:SDR family oxidoreductase [Corynebacterium liangguodongii]|uniref:Short-chain dehydrogenase n=1 Tax=Corynebacterium liangguodongii TaxID=2079535 RepID=A0A2S0WC69_9CORY|nr:SDR family oxidoreductase [Corynebacterium liangguodongii]AWB83344.1 short-chain dehydrogenase [Corynebacterium liangguodongii]PWC00566.1 short-chain dehydrogenase [Corynebacterium liangguodongii]